MFIFTLSLLPISVVGCTLNTFAYVLGLVAKPKLGKCKLSDPKFLLRQQDCRYFWLQEVSVLSPFGISLEECGDKLKCVQVFLWLCIWEGCK